MRGTELLEQLELVDLAYVDAADATPTITRRDWVRWGLLAACLCLAVGCLLSGLPRYAPETPRTDTPDAASPSADHPYPGEFRPQLLVSGTVYHWDRVSVPMHNCGTPGATVYVHSGDPSYLPEGYAEYGEITSVTTSELTEDGQLRAGCAATGTIYTSDTTPEAVYVRISTDEFRDEYIRFISPKLRDGYCVAWGGQRYRLIRDPGDSLRALPDGCKPVGTLHFIGADAIPENDLETNCVCDRFSRSIEGREVYFDPAEPDALYVYQRHEWAGGEYDTYLRCSLWPAE